MDVERTMESILQSQRTLAARLAQREPRQDQLRGSLERVAGLCEKLTSAQVRCQQNLEQMESAMAESRRLTDLSLRALAEKQSEGDKRLKALIRIAGDIARRRTQ